MTEKETMARSPKLEVRTNQSENFKKACEKNGEKYTDVLRRLISDYVKQTDNDKQ